MTLLNPKYLYIRVWRLWGTILLLLSACSPAPSATPTATIVEPTATQTERPASATPAQTASPTALPGPSFSNPVYNDNFPDPHVVLVGDTYYA